MGFSGRGFCGADSAHSRRNCLQQRQRPPLIQQDEGTTLAITDCCRSIDAQGLAGCLSQVLRSHGVLGWIGADSITRSVDLPSLYSTAGEQGRLAMDPMVAACRAAPAWIADPWLTAHFSRDYDQRLVQQASLVKIRD